MKTKFIALIFFVFSDSYLFGQETSDWGYDSKWQVRPSIGLNVPLTKLFNSTATDNLIDYHDGTTYYLQVLAVSWFFHKHWGVEFNYQGSSSNRIAGQKRGKRFSERIQNEYQDGYFVTPSSGAFYGDENIISGNVERGLIGIIYRKELDRFFIHPKFAIGVTSFYTDWGNATLKEKNSNTLLQVNYSTGERPNDHFTTAASLIMGYKLSKRIFWNFEIMTSYYNTNFTFTREIIDLTTGVSAITEYSKYKKDIFTLSLGTGLIIVLK
jgi:hypothetical protein